MTKPANGTLTAAVAPVALTARPGGNTASVTEVRFYVNKVQVGTGTNTSGDWSYTWTPPRAGYYTINSASYNGTTLLAVSSGVRVGVGVDTGPSSSAPLAVSSSAPYLGNANAGTLPGSLGVSPGGAATYGIDIVVPPGAAGVQPHLSLQYDSQAGNGLVGLGWSLSGLSRIHRCGRTIAQDNINSRIAFNTTDRLCLDGQRLVAINKDASDAGYWADDAEYRTELDRFARVRAQGTGVANRSFIVQEKDGRIMSYGSTTSGRILPVFGFVNSSDATASGTILQPDPTQKLGAMFWALDRVEDRFGNYMSVTYERKADTSHKYDMEEPVPSVIRYGAKNSSAHAAVEFRYEDRPDRWTRYMDEARNDLIRRLQSVRTYVGTNLDGALPATVVRQYDLAYEVSPTSGRSLLSSVQVSATNPQTGALESLPKTTLAWGKPDPAKSYGFTRFGSNQTGNDWANAPQLSVVFQSGSVINHELHPEYFAFMDFENHGRADALEKSVAPVFWDHSTPLSSYPSDRQPGTRKTQYRYFHNNGSGGFTLYNYRLSTNDAFAVVDVADFNGDGAPDLLVSSNGSSDLLICLSPLAAPGALGAAGSTIVFTCDANLKTTYLTNGLGQVLTPFITDVLGDGRSALFGRQQQDGTAMLCIQNNCNPVSNPPTAIIGVDYAADGSPEIWRHNYSAFEQMVDFTGVGKTYDVRWTKPHFENGTQETQRGWVGVTMIPTVSMLAVDAPSAGFAVASMIPYRYKMYAPVGPVTPTSVDRRTPYSFDYYFGGLASSADFNGTGYSGLAFGFLEHQWTSTTHMDYSRADMTLCLSTGRALDCHVRKKYSGSNYMAVRGVGNFIGDGQSTILVEKIDKNASWITPQGNGKLAMCRVLGDDVSTAADGSDDSNLVCDDWAGPPGFSYSANAGNDRILFMDLLGTGRTQMVRYHEDNQDTSTTPSYRWEVYVPNDVAVTGQALDRIYSVSNGVGATQRVEYADGIATGLVTQTASALKSYPGHLSGGLGKYVSKLFTSNGVAADQEFDYQYADPAVDVQGRGALGFRLVQITDKQTGFVTTTEYSQTWPKTGSVLSSVVKMANGSVLSNTTNTYQQVSTSAVLGAPTTWFVAPATSAVQKYDTNGADLGLLKSSGDGASGAIVYDAYGNLTDKVDVLSATGTTDTFKTVVSNKYYPADTGNWLVGQLKTASVTKSQSTLSGPLSTTRTVDYKYAADATGALTQETVQDGDTSKLMRLVTDYGRDLRGLVTSRTQTWWDPVAGASVSRVFSTTYDNSGRYQTSSSAPVAAGKSLSETYDADPATGVRTRLTGPNGLTTIWQIDGFGRVTLERRADGNETRSYVKAVSGGDANGSPAGAVLAAVTTHYHGDIQIAVPAVAYTDSVGHQLGSLSYGFDGTAIVTEQSYDTRGRPSVTYQPRFKGATAFMAKSVEYDDLNRPVKVSVPLENTSAPNSPSSSYAVTTTSYDGFITTTTNPLLQVRVDRRYLNGQTMQVEAKINAADQSPKVTKFGYDPFGNLLWTKDPNDNLITVMFDDLGRKIKLTDPDLGAISYGVDALGQLRTQTNAKSQVATMYYDLMGRMTQRQEADLSSQWVYDAQAGGDCKLSLSCGQLVEAYTGPSNNKDYDRLQTYDIYGRPSTVQQTLYKDVYTSKTSYDDWGRVVTQEHQRSGGSNKRYDQRYNGFGYLERVERGSLVLWKATKQDALQRVREAQMGNGLIEKLEYDANTQRLSTSDALAGAVDRVAQVYQYDAIGSVKLRSLYWDTSGFSETFDYDEVNRIKSSTVTGAAAITYKYDNAGNLTYKSDVGNYTYPTQGVGATRPHAVLSIDGTTRAAGNYGYDANGNQTSTPTGTYQWTSFDMPQSLTKGTVSSSFAYGPEHQRTKQVRSDGVTVVYAGAFEVEWTGNTPKVKTYWPQGLGVEIDDATGANTSLYWMHKDNLGSVVAMTKADGTIGERMDFDAWGKRRTLNGLPDASGKTTPDSIDGQIDNKGYTGHEMLDQLDLVHMNGRVYDPMVARFLSADPYIQDPENGQSYNRYSYVLNNPTNLVDPTGFFAECGDKGSPSCGEEKKKPEAEVPKVEVQGEKTKNGRDMSKFRIDVSTSGSPFAGNYVVKVTGHFGASAKNPSTPKFALGSGVAACGQCRRYKGNPTAGEIEGGASTLLDLMPGIGSGKSIAQIYTGTDIITGEPVNRGAETAGVILGMIPGAKIAGKLALSKFAGRVVAPAKRATGKTVLGHYPSYVDLSERLNARRFELPDSVWKGMSEDEIWIANQKFLDRTIMRGDEIILSNPVARPGTYYEKELNYLMDKGFTISTDASRMLPPLK
nr:RHS repeat-associated core domain-containing protein [Massilia sp. TS11]